MEISRIDIRNFKKVESISIDLGSITYLVGGNNSGKSSVLQAIHMAVSCAQSSAEFQQQVIAESSLRYSPTADFQTLGHVGPYENRRDGSRGVIEFTGRTTDSADASYKVEIYKARNYHNVGVDRSGVYPGFGQYICDPQSLFSVYVPGLAGIPHREEMQSFAATFRRAAGGDANLVFRNIVRSISDRNLLPELESLLFDIIGPCKFRVDFNQDRDLYVRVSISLADNHPDISFVPIDLCGTGVMQITQILAYVILFRPKLLLVDEPDSHLHPSRQVLLASAFARIVEAYSCKIIVSTHSRHLVSAASAGAKLVWLKNGKVETQEDNDLAAVLLDIGALDQLDATGADVLICTEDKGKKALASVVDSLNLAKDVRVISYNGVTNAASAAVIKAMSELLHKKPQIIIHRDRDFLTDTEIDKWGSDFTNRDMIVFSPYLLDVESYFCTPEHVADVYKISVETVETIIKEICNKCEEKFRQTFRNKRRDANKKFWEDGGGPSTDTLWPPDQMPSALTVLGKDLMARLNDELGSRYGRKNLLSKPSKLLAVEVRSILE